MTMHNIRRIETFSGEDLAYRPTNICRVLLIALEESCTRAREKQVSVVIVLRIVRISFPIYRYYSTVVVVLQNFMNVYQQNYLRTF